jgi:hypothetical protein
LIKAGTNAQVMFTPRRRLRKAHGVRWDATIEAAGERGPDVPDSDVTADAKRNWIVGVALFLAEEGGRSERSAILKLASAAPAAGRQSSPGREYAREMTLIGESATQGDFAD